MNLSTHTAYPEIMINDSFDWVVRILKRDGSLCESLQGTADSHQSAYEKATKASKKIQSNYLIEGK